MGREKTTRKYYPQLDSLRTFAAFGVINLHWLSSNYPSLFGIEHKSYWGFGHYGVQLFFVLSGFLITDILIKNKDTNKKGSIIGNFYARRALRLFPIYFLFLGYLILVRDQFVIDNIAWFASYTANIKFFLEGGFVDQWSNHLWTLSVEEQFYLIFPLLLLFIARKREYWIPILFILTAIVFKQLPISQSQPTELLTIAQTDMLGVGVLLGIFKNRQFRIYAMLTGRWSKGIMTLALAGCIGIYLFDRDSLVLDAVFNVLMLISFGLLVANSAEGFNGLLGRIMNNSFLQYLGKISYGLYVYHKVIPLSLVIILNKLGLSIDNIIWYYIINLSILLLAAHWSWILIEKPVMKLKSKFKYKETSALAK